MDGQMQGADRQPSVLCAFPKWELAMELRAHDFCQVLSSETLFSLFFFFFSEKSELETWWVVNQKHNKMSIFT